MSAVTIRPCPICDGSRSRQGFPYATRFCGQVFSYFRCEACRSVFVDPVPDESTFSKMYDKAAYHDIYYAEDNSPAHYVESVDFMSRHVRPGCKVLDYGCGAGGFLKECHAKGFDIIGVEFDPEAARSVADSLGCRAMTPGEFDDSDAANRVDVIHFGDVLEHLPDPMSTLKTALRCLQPGGHLYVEGPLEVNASPVYFAARAYGTLKHQFAAGRVGGGTPTHLFRTHAKAQQHFFERLGPDYECVAWTMQETGWPYSGGGLAKRAIAAFSRAIGGMTFGGVTFGNRFRAVIRHHAST